MALPSYAMNQQSFPEMYEQWLVGPLFRPFAESIILDLDLSAEDSVLDVACGTGIVARVAKERIGEGGRVIGIDVSADMLSVARKVAPGIDFRQGGAALLPLKTERCSTSWSAIKGFSFFAEKAAAAAQMRRALKKGGRLSVATWRSDEESPFLHELRLVAERHLGPIADTRYNFAEAALQTILRDAGFHNVVVKTLSRSIHFDDAGQFVRLNSMAFVGLSTTGKGMNEQQRREVVEAIATDGAAVLKRHSKGSAVDFELRTNVATAWG